MKNVHLADKLPKKSRNLTNLTKLSESQAITIVWRFVKHAADVFIYLFSHSQNLTQHEQKVLIKL